MDISSAQPVPKSSPLTKFQLKIAGVDEQTLRQCPPHDSDNARAVAEILICSWIYEASLFYIVGQRLFGTPGQMRPDLVLVPMFLASFILLIDSYMVMRSGWHLSGIEELKRGGIDLSGGMMARVKAGSFLLIRILLSVGLAQLTAIFLSLILFNADIEARVQAGYRQANAPLIAEATTLVDGAIQRATDAVTAESANLDALAKQVTALRQNEIDPLAKDPQIEQAQQEIAQLTAQKARLDDELRAAELFASNEAAGIKGAAGNSGQVGNGPRHRAAVEQVASATSHAKDAAAALEAARGRLESLLQQLAASGDATRLRAQDQRPGFEEALATETEKVAALKDQLATLTQNRANAIRAAVEHAPAYQPRDDGFLAQLVALEHIAQEDDKIAAVIILIDVTSFAFELAAVLAKITSFVPTTYAALLARDAYLNAVHIVDAMMVELNGAPSVPEAAMRPHNAPANDNRPGSSPAFGASLFGDPDDLPPQPPKRRRGRPRKNMINGGG